jgi:hypothetical protein
MDGAVFPPLFPDGDAQMRRELPVHSITKIAARTIAAVGAVMFTAGFGLLLMQFYLWSRTGQMLPVIPWLYWQEAGMPASVWVTVAGGLLAVAGAIMSDE